MGRFTNPRDLYFGEGARHEVKNLKGKKAIIVSGGSSMRRGGFLQDVEADLKEGGFEVKLFEGVESGGAVDLYVHYLRRKLGKQVIRTVHGAGYRFGLE